MSPPPIAYDVVRLLLAARLRTPRGIDRIDYGIATRLFAEWPGDCVAVMPTPWGIRTFERERVLRAQAFFEDRWLGESVPATPAPVVVAEGSVSDPGTPPRFGIETWAALAGILARSGLSLGRPVRSLPAGTVVVNAGHDGLTQAWLLRWMLDRRDVRLLAMVHDLVPVHYPQYVSPRATASHERLLDHVAAYGAAVLTPSQAVARAVSDAMVQRGRRALPVFPLPLPVQDVFLTSQPAGMSVPGGFVVCGAVEPRKNHALLLDVWDLLRARHGDACPTLTIAGAMGWNAQPLADRIGAASAQGKVCWRANLPTPTIRALMANAQGVLMPSLAEGFGLPVAEGLSLGVPVVASDIPAHREAGGQAAAYIAPTVVTAWADAIERLAFNPAAAAAATQRARSFTPTRWSDFMGAFAAILEDVSAQPHVAGEQ